MSDDNIEGLDNASLRKKCLEYGLPNVPITDTSRKLLIRKLRAAITGEKAAKKKSRHETIRVTKKRPHSRINGCTIAATSTVDNTSDAPVSQKRKTAIVLEEEDEDDEDEAKEMVTPRTRRSVSLSKTDVVTTSYSPQSVPIPATVNETESDSDSDFAAKYASTYEPITRPVAQPHKPQNTTYGLSQRKVLVEPDRTSSYRTVTVNRTSIEPEPIYKPSLPQPRYSSLGLEYSTNTSSQTSTTTGGYGSTADPPSKYTNIYVDEDDYKESETPYLSEFARNLERLRTKPIGKGVESPRNIPIQRDTLRYQSSITSRHSREQR